MVFKINISDKGKTIKLEIESEDLIGRKIGEAIKGEDLGSDFNGYELKITGTSDIAGFPGKQDVDGITLKRVLLSKGFGMKKFPKKEGRKKRSDNMPKGLRLKKTVRGNTISKDVVQINMIVLKEGSKKFQEMLPKKEEKKAEGIGEVKPEQTETPTQAA